MMGLSRKTLSRIENVVILLLACSALVLLSQTTLVQGQATTGETSGGVESVHIKSLSRCAPVAMVLSENGSRTGAWQDGSAPRLWQEGGLEAFLNEILVVSEPPVGISTEEWQEAILRETDWIWFDFLYDVPFSDDSQSGQGRRFLVTLRGDRPAELLYYCEKSGEYFSCHLSGTVSPLPDLNWPRGGGSVSFAFEEPEGTAILPDQILSDRRPDCPEQAMVNPMADLNWDLQSKLLEKLGFNLRTISIYQSVEGPVFRDGDDTLRFQSDGTISYHTTETRTGRYSALSNQSFDLQRTAESILDRVFEVWGGEENLYCSERETNEDGSVTLTYQYRIGDTEALLYSSGAEFTFQGSVLVSFEGHFVSFEETGYSPAILPIRQAAAVPAAMGQTGHELRLCYQLRDGLMQAEWVLRMEET